GLALGLGLGLAAGGARAAEPVQAGGLAVSVARAKKRCFADRIDVTGVLVPRQEVQVRAERDGLRVVQVLAKPLDEVKPNQVLAQLALDDGLPPAALLPLRAPVAGVVGRSTAVVGGPAPARTAEPLFQIMAQGEIELSAEAPPAKLARIAPGQAVAVKPLGLGPLSGKVRLVSSIADPATQLGQVRILLAAPGEARLGMFSRGTISVGESCGIAAPFSALVNGADGPTAYVVTGNHIEARPVTVGLFSEEEVEIRSGLAEADLVVVRAAPFLREGDLVRPVPPG
ncbi:efflux RND transporter periplasmic adaptor subunit, partial [Methylobacterium crusticola]